MSLICVCYVITSGKVFKYCLKITHRWLNIEKRRHTWLVGSLDDFEKSALEVSFCSSDKFETQMNFMNDINSKVKREENCATFPS